MLDTSTWYPTHEWAQSRAQGIAIDRRPSQLVKLWSLREPIYVNERHNWSFTTNHTQSDNVGASGTWESWVLLYIWAACFHWFINCTNIFTALSRRVGWTSVTSRTIKYTNPESTSSRQSGKSSISACRVLKASARSSSSMWTVSLPRTESR